MATGQPVSGVVEAQVILNPPAAGMRDFGALLIAGPTNIIDTRERLRRYASIEGVAADFGGNTPEYSAAQRFFAQSPRPSQVYIGRWAEAAVAGLLRGGRLSPAEQALNTWTNITTGSMRIDMDGVTRTLATLNFSAATNLNGVASIITAALTGGVVTWDANLGSFLVTSTTTGASSTVGFASATGSGADISAKLKLTSATASAPVNGIAAETPLAAAQILAESGAWYALMFAATNLSTPQVIAVADYIEAAGLSRIFGHTSAAPGILDAVAVDDVASLLKSGGYNRTVLQYSNTPHAIASFFGRALTVNFMANNTTITMKFKGEPTVVPETLTFNQASTLRAKNCNVFITYENDTAIVQEGVVASGQFFDTIHGTDWLQAHVQNRVWNLFYTGPTKIPQTDSGVNMIVAEVMAALNQGRINGLIGPGVWTGPEIGQLKTGAALPDGFYVYAPRIATQAPSERAARRAPVMQAAIKLAGAVHSANVLINVNA